MRPDGAVSPVRPRAESGFAATEGVHRSLNSYRRLGARSTDSPYEVVLTAAGRASFADLRYGSGHEVGGGLWSHQNGNTLVVRFATQNNEGGYSGVRMSLASLAQHAHAYRDIADLLGTWHSHEAYEGQRAQPSDQGTRASEPTSAAATAHGDVRGSATSATCAGARRGRGSWRPKSCRASALTVRDP